MTTVDITPHPRILQVLGEIEFKPSQCIAELVDNSVDEFIRSERLGTPVDSPTVKIAFGRDTIVVKDNGPGMTIEALQMAVRAGWTSNERIGNLGLYGIGFNIATARLGSVTTIWTSTSGDNHWYGLELNIKKMALGETFVLDISTRIKSDVDASGTEIEITDIRPDWKDSLQKDSWVRTNITERLARIYGTMLRDVNPQPIKFNLYVNNKRVTGWEHCVWPADWTVYKKGEGDIRPLIEIDQVYGKRFFSKKTGEFLDAVEGISDADIIEMPERVYGWIGIQRYADGNDFGIDILRYGRKIEIGNKDIFDWEDETGNPILEYPIDDPRSRGRIVGEIHLDHGYVHYTKHRFEREHSSWKQLLLAVKNNEPLTNRTKLGLVGVNESPLGKLFRVFRRNSPQSNQTYRQILFLKDNDKAKQWADKWRKGSSEFVNLKKWEEEFEKIDAREEADDEPEHENLLLTGGRDQSLQDEITQEESNSQNLPELPGTEPTPQSRTPLADFNFQVTDIGVAGKSYTFETFSIDSFDTGSNSPWRSRATSRGVYEIEVVPTHAAFKSTSLRLIDAILTEMAYIIVSEEVAGSGSAINYGDVLTVLRSRYAPSDSLDANRLIFEAEEIRRAITGRLAAYLDENQQRELLTHIPEADFKQLELAQARGPKGTRIISFLKLSGLADIIEKDQELLFRSGCISLEWEPESLKNNSDLIAIHQKELFRDIWLPISELGQFVKEGQLRDETPEYSFLIRGCLNRLLSFLQT